MPNINRKISAEDLMAVVGARDGKRILALIEAANAPSLDSETLINFEAYLDGGKLARGGAYSVVTALTAYLRDVPGTRKAMQRWATALIDENE